ncbi:MAG: hypothetical protein Q6361_03820 [Candidatus Hermodarchaeota archaeon]|nr:hypothetical protein [Candidatus Hermodarchaeota archaeon]
MTKPDSRKWYRRRELYLIAGIAFGITLMALPALTHLLLGPVSPFERADFYFVPSGELIYSPFDVLIEIFWITLPAIFFIIALYWIIVRRRRWAGHETAVKWSRR